MSSRRNPPGETEQTARPKTASSLLETTADADNSSIPFVKMQSAGNDFVIVDGLTRSFSVPRESIRHIADRHFGVGCDQLLVLQAPSSCEADFHCTIYNADGSEPEQCGNGLCCLAHYILRRQLAAPPLRISVGKRIMTVCKTDEGVLELSLGEPQLDPQSLPFIGATGPGPTYPLQLPEDILKGSTDSFVGVSGKRPQPSPELLELGAVSLGNPHLVVEVSDLSAVPIATLGNAIAHHPRLPEGANVGFMQIISRQHIQLRVWERGSGDTLACGSGACAAVVVGHLCGRLDPQVKVQLPGGVLQVHWAGGASPALLSGPTAEVFSGLISSEVLTR